MHEPRVAIISFPRSVKTSEHLDLNFVNITSKGDVRTFPPLKVGAQRHYVPSEIRIAAAAIESKSKFLVSNSNWDSNPGYEQFSLSLSYMSTINKKCYAAQTRRRLLTASLCCYCGAAEQGSLARFTRDFLSSPSHLTTPTAQHRPILTRRPS